MSEPSYLREDPFSELTVLEVPACPAAVVEAREVSWEDLPTLFDRTFAGLFPVLTEAGAEPAWAAFALYTRQRSETVDLQAGFAIPKGLTRTEPLARGMLVNPS